MLDENKFDTLLLEKLYFQKHGIQNYKIFQKIHTVNNKTS